MALNQNLQNRSKKNTTFPPVETQCPDYWGTKDGECIVPDTMNKGTLSSVSGTEMDFTGASYDTICKKNNGLMIMVFLGMEFLTITNVK